MATTNYFDHVIDPSTGNSIEVRDTYAREQLVHKTEKTIVNSLPAKPTSQDEWLNMERFIYYVPMEGETDKYEAWTLFFTVQNPTAADYTDTDNYQWVQLAVTDSDLNNFSTKGHTHEVVTEVSVDDHEYTPEGTVSGSFTGSQGTTSSNSHDHSFTPSGSVSNTVTNPQVTTSSDTHSHTVTPTGDVTSTFTGDNNTTSEDTHSHTVTPTGDVTSTFTGNNNTTSEDTHSHTYTPSGDVTSSFTGTASTTDSGTAQLSVTKTNKKLSTKSVAVTPVTSVDFTGSTTNAKRATGDLETLSTYDATKAVFNGISVSDGVLSFDIKKMTVADTVSALSASIDASKVTVDNAETATTDVATGALETDANATHQVLTDVSVSDSGHTHGFTPSGSVSATFTGDEQSTDSDTHSHTVTPTGSVTSTFTGNSNTTSSDTHSHTVTPTGSITSTFTGNSNTTSSDTHDHTVTTNVGVESTFSGSAGTTSEVSHTHTITPSGSVAASFTGVKKNLKHTVNNSRVRTGPDEEEESVAFGWYGILFKKTESSPEKTRVGNNDLHRTLPIQSQMRRCLLKDNGEVYNYLDPDDSTIYAQGSVDAEGNVIAGMAAELSGTAYSTYGDTTSTSFNVQVMVEIPEHWRRVYEYIDGTDTMVKAIVSPYKQDTTGWVHVKKGYISAYEANITSSKLCSTSNIVDLTLTINESGKYVATCDVSEATQQSDITSQLPTTSVTMNTLRTAARARGEEGEYKWNMLVYEQYIALYWLYVIEFANLNSQASVNDTLTAEGYRQGGIGAGATTVTSANWSSFNSYRPFVPCGITNCLGNSSGEVLLTLPSGLGGSTILVNSYRGVELPFGHIWKFADGIKYLGDGTQQSVLRCDSPVNYSSDSSSTNYTSIGNNVGSNGYKSEILVGDDGDINCTAVGGGSNTYYCDYNYQAHTDGTYYCCLLGGNATDGASAGLAYVSSTYGVSISLTSFGSRLCFFEK